MPIPNGIKPAISIPTTEIPKKSQYWSLIISQPSLKHSTGLMTPVLNSFVIFSPQKEKRRTGLKGSKLTPSNAELFVNFLDIIFQHPIARKLRSQGRKRTPHAFDPFRRQAVLPLCI